MTITEMVQNQQQQRGRELAQKQSGKPHVNPYGTPGMSLNNVEKQVKQIAFKKKKNGYGMSNGEDISQVIKNYVLSIEPEQRLSASWTLNEIFHKEAVRLGDFVQQQNPGWNWGEAFDTSILDNYQQGFNIKI